MVGDEVLGVGEKNVRGCSHNLVIDEIRRAGPRLVLSVQFNPDIIPVMSEETAAPSASAKLPPRGLLDDDPPEPNVTATIMAVNPKGDIPATFYGCVRLPAQDSADISFDTLREPIDDLVKRADSSAATVKCFVRIDPEPLLFIDEKGRLIQSVAFTDILLAYPW